MPIYSFPKNQPVNLTFTALPTFFILIMFFCSNETRILERDVLGIEYVRVVPWLPCRRKGIRQFDFTERFEAGEQHPRERKERRQGETRQKGI